MKKLSYIAIIFLTLITLTGCNKKEEIKLDLEKITIELNNTTYESDGKDLKLFESNKTVDATLLKEKYGVDASHFEEFTISIPELADAASMFAIFLPKTGEEAKAEEEIKSFFTKYDQAWTMGYFPEEEKLVKDRMEETYGNYKIYIISHDNEKVLDKIKNMK